MASISATDGRVDREAGTGGTEVLKEEEHKQRKPKRQKPAPTNDPALWPRCKFWMMKKGRFCNMAPCPGADFCGVHVAEVGDGEPPKPPSQPLTGQGKKGAGHGALGAKDRVTSQPEPGNTGPPSELAEDPADVEEDGEPTEGDETVGGTRKRKGRSWRDRGGRVPCPHDPSHTVYERELAKHMLSCPGYTRQLEMEAQPFFKRNINLCSDDPRRHEAATAAAPLGAVGQAAVAAEEEKEEEELRSGIVNPKLDSMLRRELDKGVELKTLKAKIKQAYQELVGEIRTEVLCPAACKSLLEGKSLLSAEPGNPERQGDGQAAAEKASGTGGASAQLGRGANAGGKDQTEAAADASVEASEPASEAAEAPAAPRVPVNLPGFRQLRHVEQQASIVGHMQARCVLLSHTPRRAHGEGGLAAADAGVRDRGAAEGEAAEVCATEEVTRRMTVGLSRRGLLEDGLTYVEMGAGRGMLSLTLRHAAPRAKLVFIERSGCRNKADRQLRGLEGEGKFSRIRMDIAHLELAGVDVVRDDLVVGIGKHLCGEATDLALRCLLHRGAGEGAGEGAGAGGCRVRGLAIATCCHHRCLPRSFVNRPYIRRVLGLCGLGGGEGGDDLEGFELLQLMTSWACCTCGQGAKAKEEGKGGAAGQGLTREEREEVGRQCKRLLDMGRVEWLREAGLQAELVHFCARETSPENCLLLAWT